MTTIVGPSKCKRKPQFHGSHSRISSEIAASLAMSSARPHHNLQESPAAVHSQSQPSASSIMPSTPQHSNFQEPTAKSKSTKDAMAISSILLKLTPPEQKPYDNFSQGPQGAIENRRGNPSHNAPSPPVSPPTPAINQVTTNTVGRNVDPIIFPDEPAQSIQPLFPQLTVENVRPSASEATAQGPAPPRMLGPLEPRLFTPSVPIRLEWGDTAMLDATEEERQSYSSYVAEERKAMFKIWNKPQVFRVSDTPKRVLVTNNAYKKHRTLAAKPAGSSSSGSNVDALIKSATGSRNSTKVHKSTTSRAGRTSAPRQLFDSMPLESSPPRTTKKPKTAKTQAGDIDFERVPDYCPPIDSMLNNGQGMVIRSVNNPRVWTEEDKKFLHLLHPMEQELARCECLSPLQYLTTKRRIFVDRLYFYHFEKEQQAIWNQQGKEKIFEKRFLRTHAQEAGKIDVNKSSRLFAAFESVGWIDRRWCHGYPKPTFDNKEDRYLTAEEYARGLQPGPDKLRINKRAVAPSN